MKTPTLLSTKAFALLFASAFGLTLVLSVLGHALEPSLSDTDPDTIRRLRPYAVGVFFALFLIMAFSVVPVMVRVFFKVFTKMQKMVGNENHPIVRSLIAAQEQERIGTILILVYWGIFIVGLIIASPHLAKMWAEIMAE